MIKATANEMFRSQKESQYEKQLRFKLLMNIVQFPEKALPTSYFNRCQAIRKPKSKEIGNGNQLISCTSQYHRHRQMLCHKKQLHLLFCFAHHTIFMTQQRRNRISNGKAQHIVLIITIGRTMTCSAFLIPPSGETFSLYCPRFNYSLW